MVMIRVEGLCTDYFVTKKEQVILKVADKDVVHACLMNDLKEEEAQKLVGDFIIVDGTAPDRVFMYGESVNYGK